MNTHHPGPDDGTGDGLGPVLAEAMAGLQAHEPGMPDLLGPAMAQGTRIRRRRRATLLAGLAAAVVIGAGGALGGLGYVGDDQGRSTSPAVSPTVGAAAEEQTLGPAERLISTLRTYLDPYGLTLAAKPWTVRPDVQDGVGNVVVVTVQDAAGNTAALRLSVWRTPQRVMPTGLPGVGCSLLFKMDRELAAQNPQDTASCKAYPPSGGGAYSWAVTIVRPAPDADRRIGAIRIGPDDTVMRAWGEALPEVPPPGVFVLREELLADLARDSAVTQAVDAVAAEQAAGRPGGAAVPWDTATLPVPNKYAPGTAPPSAGQPKP